VSVSVNQSKIHSDYASVQEQSGIRAGDGGFQIKVGGNTDLKGAVISSTGAGAAVSSLVTATLTHSDIANHATMEASSIGLNGSTTSSGGGADGKGQGPGGTNLINAGGSGSGVSLTGVVSLSDNEARTSRSGISAAKITITDDAAQRVATGTGAVQALAGLNRNVAADGDTSGRIDNHFEPNATHATLAVTAAFTASAAPLAAKMVGDVAPVKQDTAQHAAYAYGDLAKDATQRSKAGS
jgi:filamentous hemagglutinin